MFGLHFLGHTPVRVAKAGTDAEVIEDYHLLACSSWFVHSSFLDTLGSGAQGWHHSPHWIPTHQSSIKKMFHRSLTGQSYDVFSYLRFPFGGDTSMDQVENKLINTPSLSFP